MSSSKRSTGQHCWRCRQSRIAYAEWRRCRVAPDYHVEVHGHFYSVPSRLIREVVEARITDTTIEIASTPVSVSRPIPRSALKRRHTTTPRAHAEAPTGATPAGRQRECLLSFAAQNRARNGRAGRDGIMRASRIPSRAFPGVPGHSAAGQDLWRSPARKRPGQQRPDPSVRAPYGSGPRRSCAPVSTGHSTTMSRLKLLPCCMRTSAAAVTTTEKEIQCLPIPPRNACWLSA